MPIRNLWQNNRLYACAFIDQLVKDKSYIFFPDGYQSYEVHQATDKIPSVKKLQKIDVFVIYFPSKWSGGLQALCHNVVSGMRSEAVIMIIDISPDALGHGMCRFGDEMKQCLNMVGVIDHCLYMGDHPDLKEQFIMTAQFWAQEASRSVSLQDWVTY